ncbi:phosphopantetheine-binding protein [Lichenicoccus roseus]|nr:acyl carrier protein [Lichenicoccus roseus]
MTELLESSILTKVISAIDRTCFLRDVRITATSRFEEDLDMDSIELMEVLLHLEEVFGTVIRPEAIAGFFGVQDVVRHLSGRFFADAEVADGDVLALPFAA